MAERIEITTKTFIRFWLVSLSFVLISVFVWKAMAGLIIVGLAIFLAIAIRPLANQIDKIYPRKDNSALTAVVAVILVVGLLGAAIALVGPVVVNETGRFIGQVSENSNAFGGWNGIDAFGDSLGIRGLQDKIVGNLESFSRELLSNVGNVVVVSVGAVANIVTATILVIALTLLFLLQGPAILEKMWTSLAGKNTAASKVGRRLSQRIAGVISKYVFGQVTVSILDGLVVSAAVFVLALIFEFSAGLALPMGLIAATFYLIPMFGPIISCAIITILLSFNMPAAGLSFAIFYIIYAQIENNLIAPKIQGGAMKLPSLVILVAITIGMYMFGLVGAIISIPIAGCIKVLIDEYPNLRALK